MNYSLIEYVSAIIMIVAIVLSIKLKNWKIFVFALAGTTVVYGIKSGMSVIDSITNTAVSFILIWAFIYFRSKPRSIHIGKKNKTKNINVDNPVTNTLETESSVDTPNIITNNETVFNYKSNRSIRIGKQGETVVFDELRQLEKYGAIILSNIYIPKNDGTTTEIDIVVLTKMGIFVIECKNYSGWIFGSVNSKYWMQTLESGAKNQFYNPIMQNAGHCKYLKSYLNDYSLNILSYIVFSDRCTFKDLPVNTDTYRIIHKRHLISYIEEEIERRPTQFTDEQFDSIYNTLLPLTNVSDEVKEKHIEQIESKNQ